MIVCDAGFAIPDGVETIDLSLSANSPTVEMVIDELVKFHSVERLVVARDTEISSPAKVGKVRRCLPEGCPMDVITHAEMKVRAKSVKTVVRTGDFAAYANFLLVSGAGGRWYDDK